VFAFSLIVLCRRLTEPGNGAEHNAGYQNPGPRELKESPSEERLCAEGDEALPSMSAITNLRELRDTHNQERVCVGHTKMRPSLS
jgi:hypothetical protein